MKMKVKALIICLLAVSATVLASAGCSHEEQPAVTYSDSLTPHVSKIDMPFQIEKVKRGGMLTTMSYAFQMGRDLSQLICTMMKPRLTRSSNRK